MAIVRSPESRTVEIIVSQLATAGSVTANKTLLIVGPKPPPIGGSPLTVQAILEELRCYPMIRVKLLNTSPAMDVRRDLTGFNFEKVRRFASILPAFIREAHDCDAIIVFANDLFSITIVPFLLLLARLYHTPFFIKPVGAGLDLFVANQNPLLRTYLLGVLRKADGILAQTTVLQKSLIGLGCVRTDYLPGCRPVLDTRIAKDKQCNGAQTEFRLIFLSHITRKKGPLVILEALQMLQQTFPRQVICDFYGPIHDEVRDDFLRGLTDTATAHYRGMAEPGTAAQIISEYDALVLPTFFDAEGHPGVLIEAMLAAVPVITTRIRAIHDLVIDGENGLLIPMHDARALAAAIQKLASDRELLKRMGEASCRKGMEFRADAVVGQMLQIVFPGTLFEKASKSS